MAGRLFVSRLDEARSPDANIPEVKRTPISGMAPVDVARHPVSERQMAQPRTPHSTPKAQFKYDENSDIIEKLCEYLFDLFDANVMDDYIRMERFELRAIESFRTDEPEYTHEQYDLHKEFIALFEQLVEGFLANEGYTSEVFYKELKHFIAKSPQKGPNAPKLNTAEYYNSGAVTPADEVMEVIHSYMQFDVWAGLMRKQAQQRGVFLTTKDKLIQAAAAVSSAKHAHNDNVATALFKDGDDDVQDKAHHK